MYLAKSQAEYDAMLKRAEAYALNPSRNSSEHSDMLRIVDELRARGS